MRISTSIVRALIALCLSSLLVPCGGASVLQRDGVGELVVRAAQDGASNNLPSPTSVPTKTGQKKSIKTPEPTSIATGDASKPTEKTSSVSTEEKSTSKTSASESTRTGAAPVMTATEDINPEHNVESNVYSGGLPIEPTVTPGMGVAGVFLMVLGLAYGLIGIKVKRLHIFLSSAFLVGLAVTVLIVYVMNPPVKNAIQGAYVVASVMTALIAGGLAVIFPEVTEGLGCLLGGFCLAMWFLIIKPGGLITETYGKIIMIAVFSLVTFAMAFHRITKPYGLIFSLSFAGATATILGIDCFSRAGMKEFWLYVWALNNDRMFPLNTNTYPHTRGIRVEIAGIIILTALNIMSQVKLWKIVRERRAVKEAVQREQDAQLEAMDEETGRRVEEQNQTERKEWEAVYGNGNNEKGKKASSESERPSTGQNSRTDSGLGHEVYKKGDSSQDTFIETEEMKEARQEHMQMVDMDDSSTPTTQNRETNSSASPTPIPIGVDDISVIGTNKDLNVSEHLGPAVSRRQSDQTAYISNRESIQSSVGRFFDGSSVLKQKEVSRIPPPPVVPLPLPTAIQQEYDQDSDRSSIATAADSNRGSVGAGHMTFEMPNMVLPVEFDRASSIAATCDGPMEDENLSELSRHRTQSPFASPADLAAENDLKRSSMLSIQLTDENNRNSEISDKAGSFLEIKPELLQTEDFGVKKISSARTSSEVHPKASNGPATKRPLQPVVLPEDLAPASYPRSKPSSTISPSGSFEVQTHCSKVVKTFRTNEWAKHLTEAETPELEELEKPIEAVVNEKPAPLNIDQLQETSEINSKQSGNQRVPSGRKSVTASPPTRVNSSPLPPMVPESISPEPVIVEDYSLIERSPSVMEVERQRYSNPPMNTLLGQRESIVRSRSSLNVLPEYEMPQAPSSVSGAHPRSNSAFSNRSTYNSGMRTLSHQTSANNLHGQMLSDDMPLSDRQHLLHQTISIQSLRQQQSRSVTPHMQGPHLPPQRRESNPQIQPPKRASVETFNQWREGLRSDPRVNGQTLQADQRREEMLSERNRLAMLERQRMQQGNLTGDMIEDRMRQKDMLELHREAMRKMQHTANKNA